ncbi:hypothetical protein G6F58_013642 [Rhizopus delemar]|nr:hypothetical protein G6F58_013642 [Rhizopus delemar]
MLAAMNVPSGNPASRQAASSSCAVPTMFSAGFSRKPLPPIRIGTAARITCQYGKFHGMMPSTTPNGR